MCSTVFSTLIAIDSLFLHSRGRSASFLDGQEVPFERTRDGDYSTKLSGIALIACQSTGAES